MVIGTWGGTNRGSSCQIEESVTVANGVGALDNSPYRALKIRSFASSILQDVFKTDFRTGELLAPSLFGACDRALSSVAVTISVCCIVVIAPMCTRASTNSARKGASFLL